MEKEIKTFQPIGFIDELLNLERAINKAKLVNEHLDVEGLLLQIKEEKKQFYDKIDKLLNYIRNFWGKYVHMEFQYNSNYSSTREDKPVWTTDYSYNALLYRYNKGNDALFGIYSRLSDIYNGSLKDDVLNLLEIMRSHRLFINEITKEEFMQQLRQTNKNVLEYRLDKLNSENYILTNDGYVYSNEYDNKSHEKEKTSY